MLQHRGTAWLQNKLKASQQKALPDVESTVTCAFPQPGIVSVHSQPRSMLTAIAQGVEGLIRVRSTHALAPLYYPYPPLGIFRWQLALEEAHESQLCCKVQKCYTMHACVAAKLKAVTVCSDCSGVLRPEIGPHRTRLTAPDPFCLTRC